MPKAPKRYRLHRDNADPKRRPTQVPASVDTRDRIRELARRSGVTQALVLERLLDDHDDAYLEKYANQLESLLESHDERLRRATQEDLDAKA